MREKKKTEIITARLTPDEKSVRQKRAMDEPEPPAIPTWSESKQRSREALKRLALGQKLSNEQDYGYDFQW